MSTKRKSSRPSPLMSASLKSTASEHLIRATALEGPQLTDAFLAFVVLDQALIHHVIDTLVEIAVQHSIRLHAKEICTAYAASVERAG